MREHRRPDPIAGEPGQEVRVVLASFAATAASWHDFYMLVGSAAATLLGLLFVAVSLNLRLFTELAHPKLRVAAVTTFSSFLYLVLVALMFLVPDPTATDLAWPLLAFSVVMLVNAQREAGRARRLLDSGLRGYLLEVVPTVCYLWVIGAAVAALPGDHGLLTSGWMVATMATLLGTATSSAWDLLVRAGSSDT